MSDRLSCPREADVFDLVAIGGWPGRADEALRDHVATCQACSDVALISQAVRGLADEGHAEVKVPDAAVVWHRASIRTREELARRAARPVTLVTIVAALSVLALAVAGWPMAGPLVAGWWSTTWTPRLDVLAVPTATWWSGYASPAWEWAGAAILAWTTAVFVLFYLVRMADRSSQPEQR